MILEFIDSKKAKIMDPWPGKKRELDAKVVMRAISSLKNNLKISPKVIEISRDF